MDPSQARWTVWGIAELACWIQHFPHRMPTGRDAEDCLDAHTACGIRHVVWNLGRSVLAYHSDLPEATCAGDFVDLPGLGVQERASGPAAGARVG